jgi:acetyltransferase-like isoleucine patch superfamily enzyme
MNDARRDDGPFGDDHGRSPRLPPPVRIAIGDGGEIGTGGVVIAKRDQASRLGDRCILAAGAVVTSDVEPDTIMAGPLAAPLIPRGTSH